MNTNMENLTKEQVIEARSMQGLASLLDLDYVETTSEHNGYPRNLNCAIISESIQQLNDLADKLKSLGFEVNYLELQRKDGQGLWYRCDVPFFDKGKYQIVDDQDYYFDYDPSWTEQETKKNLIEDVIEDSEIVDILYSEMQHAKAKTRFFLDGNNDYGIDYGVSEDAACYSYDTRNYQLAIEIEGFDKN